MKVLSVNIGERTTISWRGKTVETGIYKMPTNGHIVLGLEDVVNDQVVDRKHHGGKDMAVYAYSKANYLFFQKLYPELKLTNGFFGENITLEELDESIIQIGDTFQLGEAIIQASQSRKPCYKLGVRFGTQRVVKQFLESTFCGIYFRVLQVGKVTKGDALVLIEKAEDSLTVAEVYSAYSFNNNNIPFLEKILSLEFIAERVKDKIRSKLAS